MRNPLTIRTYPNTKNRGYTRKPSDQECVAALKGLTPEARAEDPEKLSQKELYGCPRQLPDAHPVGLRIDIPAFESTLKKYGVGTYVITVHCSRSGGRVGPVLGYDNYGRVGVAVFFANERAVAEIASGRSTKTPCATVEGLWNPDRRLPADIEDWLPVGFNPHRAPYFYSKRDGRNVKSGAEAISVGNTVFVYDPVYA